MKVIVIKSFSLSLFLPFPKIHDSTSLRKWYTCISKKTKQKTTPFFYYSIGTKSQEALMQADCLESQRKAQKVRSTLFRHIVLPIS